MSSANRLIFNSISPIQIPGIIMFLLIFIATISAAITKRNGEIGHPCQGRIQDWSEGGGGGFQKLQM